ncbi:MAG: DNA/RNA nuclease SfsA [Clostridia bacterium]|nr:DNA/RNA nuclease SfsA [Clostridia bacterium]
MNYQNILKAEFLSRINRFIAEVRIGDETHRVHVKNTGRCRELLIPGTAVWLAKSSNSERKTAYDLVTVEKPSPGGEVIFVNLDSQLPNAAVAEWLPHSGLFRENAVIRREVQYGNSRFDLYIEDGDRRAFMEVKGVTLEENGIARFPDAPTERGIKHLQELCKAAAEGYEAYILFVIQMKAVHAFSPNEATHAAFADALRYADAHGVHILAMDCIVTPDTMKLDNSIPVRL